MTEHGFNRMRDVMVSNQLRTTGVNDPRILAAIGAVPRERFVPADKAPAAYADMPLPIGNGRSLNSPMALGKLLAEASPQPGDRAMVIGVATGYSAAVLSPLVASVVAVEDDLDLAERARAALAGYANVMVKAKPLAQGFGKGAPYDLILIDGAVEQVPAQLIGQLADGGRLATGLVEQGVQRLAIGRRAGEGFGLRAFADAASAELPGFARPRTFSF